jgi:hypothetical protein
MTTEAKFSLKVPNSPVYNLFEQNSTNNSNGIANLSRVITGGGPPYSFSGVNNITNHITLDSSSLPSSTFSLVGERTGSNIGSDLAIISYDDDAKIKSTPLVIKRSNDNVILNGPLKLLSLTDNVNGNITAEQFSLNLVETNTFNVFGNGNNGTVIRIGDVASISCRFFVESAIAGQTSYNIFFVKPIDNTSPDIYGFNGSIKNLTKENIPFLLSAKNDLQSETQFEIEYKPSGVVVDLGDVFEITCCFTYTIIL